MIIQIQPDRIIFITNLPMDGTAEYKLMLTDFVSTQETKPLPYYLRERQMNAMEWAANNG